MDMDSLAQQQLEEQRMIGLLLILQKADMARRDGYFTQQDIEDMQREFGLTTRQLKPLDDE